MLKMLNGFLGNGNEMLLVLYYVDTQNKSDLHVGTLK
jgi:hypothetical protein